MPTNKKENYIFTAIMCSLMVLGMSIYNLVLHNALTLEELIKGYIPGLIIAFILDEFIVSFFAKFVVSIMPIKEDNKLHLILTMTFSMVLGMVTFMSLFGVIMEVGITEHISSDYILAWKMNLIAALPLQLIIVGPISRKVLTMVQA